jgi:hypothetical protein
MLPSTLSARVWSEINRRDTVGLVSTLVKWWRKFREDDISMTRPPGRGGEPQKRARQQPPIPMEDASGARGSSDGDHRARDADDEAAAAAWTVMQQGDDDQK